ncbi:hypothetical protein DNHGIG_27770 [Collibacillus ludicampi]|uniref:Uncharacterized protein n=1 Tax=Collibacillus ludicampi TaxID=2771369 RepID=A0AAV4LHI4_9BACL|nr:hypothetical protein [Collibacillus ludicampi]GIM47228.1 hypothetical protein DNHGIG_27770 [Collibacillus ludicampi]
MSHKTRIKKFRIELCLDDELRCKLAELVNGHTDTVHIDDVFFRHLRIEEVKADCLKVEDIKMKKGCIECLKISAFPPGS